MNPLNKFTYRYSYWRYSIEFFSDYVVHTGDMLGCGLDTKKVKIFRKDLAKQIVEARKPGSQYAWSARMSGLYFILSVFFYELPGYSHYLAYPLFILFILALSTSAYYFKTRDWIFVYDQNGKCVLSLMISRWSSEERHRFRQFYAHWLITPSYFGNEGSTYTESTQQP